MFRVSLLFVLIVTLIAAVSSIKPVNRVVYGEDGRRDTVSLHFLIFNHLNTHHLFPVSIK